MTVRNVLGSIGLFMLLTSAALGARNTSAEAKASKDGGKKAFLDSCVQGAKDQLGDAQASKYCNCVADHTYGKYTDADLMKMDLEQREKLLVGIVSDCQAK